MRMWFLELTKGGVGIESHALGRATSIEYAKDDLVAAFDKLQDNLWLKLSLDRALSCSRRSGGIHGCDHSSERPHGSYDCRPLSGTPIPQIR